MRETHTPLVAKAPTKPGLTPATPSQTAGADPPHLMVRKRARGAKGLAQAPEWEAG